MRRVTILAVVIALMASMTTVALSQGVVDPRDEPGSVNVSATIANRSDHALTVEFSGPHITASWLIQPRELRDQGWSVPYKDPSDSHEHTIRVGDCTATLVVTTHGANREPSVDVHVAPNENSATAYACAFSAWVQAPAMAVMNPQYVVRVDIEILGQK